MVYQKLVSVMHAHFSYSKSCYNHLPWLTKPFYFRETSHGFYTKEHWKCSDTAPSSWTKPTFDDSDWPAAAFYASLGWYSNTAYRNNFMTQSKFIHSGTGSNHFFCRGRICHGQSNSHSVLSYIIFMRFHALDDVHLLKLTGLGMTVPDNCYGEGDSLLELTGPYVTVTDCVFACMVRLNLISTFYSSSPGALHVPGWKTWSIM